MKRYRSIQRTLRLCICCSVLLAAGLPAFSVQAQSPNDTQVRLLEEALEYRQAGDLEQAKAKLEQLLALNPNDPSIRTLLDSVEAGMAAPASQPEPRRPSLFRRPEPAPVVESPELAAERRRMEVAKEEASAFRQAATRLSETGAHREAIISMQRGLDILPEGPATAQTAAAMETELAELYLRHAQARLQEGDLEGARAALDAYSQVGAETRRTERAARRVQADIESPARIPIDDISPGFTEEREQIRHLLRVGRAQLINGDFSGAEQTFREVESIDSYNAEAKAMLKRIAEMKQRRSHLDRQKTREEMMEAVATAWQLPQVFVKPQPDVVEEYVPTDTDIKLDTIIIPSVNFQDIPLSRAIATLSAISEEFDPMQQGVNMVVLPGRDGGDPLLSINVRELTLRRVLNLMVDQAGYRYDIVDEVIEVRPGVRVSRDLVTDSFPVSRPTIRRLLGLGAEERRPAAIDDPFAPPQPAAPAPARETGESAEIRRFLSRTAGIDFSIPGADLTYDGVEIWVTQTPGNIRRIRNVFARLTDVRQVEIEAKFMEINEAVLNELGFNWAVASPGGSSIFRSSNRNMAGAFAGSQGTSTASIVVDGVAQEFPVSPPVLPGVVPLGAGAVDFAQISGMIDGYEVSTLIRMLSQRSGTDLLSAPKVTVLSGQQASITVAQEIRYPDSYGDTQSEVGQTGTGIGAGSAGVTITPGTPQDFQRRNVGVELSVRPEVQQDDSIRLELNPRVTEFQGFIEYGGRSIAIQGNTTASIPSGFYQPVFATREVNTTVNIWDGATVVMGGLTREEVRKIHDKTPILGDVPLFGRLFRTEGQASEKRNLLIFVTANLVSPGGSPLRQQHRTVEPGSIFQNPTVLTPGGTVSRQRQLVD